jgi:superfamily I DNA/RNA helicase
MKTPTIILGPPGTGKTTKLLTIVDSLLNSGTEPESIGYVSFTRKAVQEARDRAVAKFKLPTDKFKYFRTMHSLALENSNLNTAKLMDDEKFEEFSKIMGLYVPVKSVEDEETGMKMYNNKYLNIMQNARHRGVPLRTEYNQGGFDFSFTVLQKFANGYNKFKQARGYFDFTDMIEEYVIRGDDIPLDALFIDEAQDLNFLQLKMKEKATG